LRLEAEARLVDMPVVLRMDVLRFDRVGFFCWSYLRSFFMVVTVLFSGWLPLAFTPVPVFFVPGTRLFITVALNRPEIGSIYGGITSRWSHYVDSYLIAFCSLV